jgi:hypothetical protein
MKLSTLILCMVLVLTGCATQDRIAVPPMAPHACPSAVVDSEEALAALVGCTHILGDLTIAGGAVTDLQPLGNLWNVEGTLGIHGSNLKSLAGLSRLQRVDNLAIVGNAKLASLEGLASFQTARGVTIADNPRLRNLAGLGRLTRLEGLFLSGNGLYDLRGLDNLETAGDLVIVNNRKLIDLSALGRVQHLSSLTLEGNPAIAASLGLLDGLERVGGSITVANNWGLSEQDRRKLTERAGRKAVASNGAQPGELTQ